MTLESSARIAKQTDGNSPSGASTGAEKANILSIKGETTVGGESRQPTGIAEAAAAAWAKPSSWHSPVVSLLAVEQAADAGLPKLSLVLDSAPKKGAKSQGDSAPKSRDTSLDVAPETVLKPRNEQERDALHIVQSQLQDWLLQKWKQGQQPPQLAPPEASETAQSAFKTYSALITALRSEEDAGIYGKDTKQLYTNFLKSWQDDVCPSLMRQLTQKGLDVPAGAPGFVVSVPEAPLQQVQERPVSLHSKETGDPSLRANLNIDPEKIPTADDVRKLKIVGSWIGTAFSILQTAQQSELDRRITDKIKTEHLPATYEPPAELSPEAHMQWLQDVSAMLDSVSQVNKYAQEIKLINEASSKTGGQSPMPYPPGVIGFDQQGLIQYQPDFPPADLSKVRLSSLQTELSTWEKDYGKKADDTAGRIALSKLNFATVLTWNDVPVEDKKGVFAYDSHSKLWKFIDLADPSMSSSMPGVKALFTLDNNKSYTFVGYVDKSRNYEPKVGEELRDIQLSDISVLRSRFKVSENADRSEIVLTQTIQPLQGAVYSYQDLVGVTPIGSPYTSVTKYKPNDLLPIMDSSGFHLIAGRDLKAAQQFGQASYVSGKGLSIIADAAMVALAAPEVKALGLAIKAGGKLGTEVILHQTLKTVLRGGAAATVVFDNSEGQKNYWTNLANMYRAVYYGTDMALGRFGKVDVLSPSKPFADFMRATEDPFTRVVSTTSEKLLKPIVIASLGKLGGAILNAYLKQLVGQEENPLVKTGEPVAMQVGTVSSARGPEERESPSNILTTLSSYEQILLRDADRLSHNDGDAQRAKSQIETIFEKTKTLLASKDPAHDSERLDYIGELISKEHFSSQFSQSDVTQLNQLLYQSLPLPPYAGPLSKNDLSFLFSGQQPTAEVLSRFYPDGGTVPPAWLKMPLVEQAVMKKAQQLKADAAAGMWQDSGGEGDVVRTARLISALMLAKNPSGKLPDTVDTRIWAATTNYEQQFLPATTSANLSLPVKTSELISKLEHQLTSLPTEDGTVGSVARALGSQSLVIGAALRSLGVIGDAAYAQILQSVVVSKDVSKSDKIDALLGCAGPGYVTFLSASAGSSDGSGTQTGANQVADSSVNNAMKEQFKRTLDELAIDAKEDPDVRAMAALLSCLSKGDSDTFRFLLPTIERDWRECSATKSPPGTFANHVSALLLKTELAEDAPIPQILNAAEALIKLGGDDNALAAAQGLLVVSNSRRSHLSDLNTAMKLLFQHQPGEQPSDSQLSEAICDALQQKSPAAAQAFLKHKAKGDLHSSLLDLYKGLSETVYEPGELTSPDRLATTPFTVLKQKDPASAEAFLKRTMPLVEEILKRAPTISAANKQAIPELISNALSMSASGSLLPKQLSALDGALYDCYSQLALSVGPLDVSIKRAALEAIAGLPDKAASDELFYKIAAPLIGGPRPEAGEGSPEIQLLALSILEARSWQSGNSTQRARFIEWLGTIHIDEGSDPVTSDRIERLKAKYGVASGADNLSNSGLVPAQISGADLTAANAWIKSHYPMLIEDQYEAAIASARKSDLLFPVLWNGLDRVTEKEMQANNAIEQERAAEWQALRQQAMPVSDLPQAQTDSELAKKALYSIIVQDGIPIESPPAGQSTGTPYFLPTTTGSQWQLKAAEALIEASKPGTTGQPSSVNYLVLSLKSGKLAPATIKLLVEAWRTNGKPSYSQYINVLTTVIDQVEREQESLEAMTRRTSASSALLQGPQENVLQNLQNGAKEREALLSLLKHYRDEGLATP